MKIPAGSRLIGYAVSPLGITKKEKEYAVQ